MPDVLVVGHVTKDVIGLPGEADREQVGGSAYYAAQALKALGRRVAVVTAWASDDDEALRAGFDGVDLHVGSSDRSTVFENRYASASLRERRQRVLSVARPLTAADLSELSARAAHVGPLTASELDKGLITKLRQRVQLLALDVQGYLRRIEDEEVHLGEWTDAQEILQHVDIVKADDQEAMAVSGKNDPLDAARWIAGCGVSEVLVTFADRGSLVLHGETLFSVNAVPPEKTVDATGCGDTYGAAYLHARLDGQGPEAAGHFAAAAASCKLAGHGPLQVSADRVRAVREEAMRLF